MRKLALSEEILLQIEKPARYIGGEINMVKKDLHQVDVRFCMCFPDVYEVGMSHLGIQILYDMLNKQEGTWCERVYSPWVDLDAIMRREQIPLFALESQDPVRDFDFLGITLQYEMCYTNVLQILDLAKIPLHASDRSASDPIVIGGGPCSYNPEPIAEFFDIFYMGEGETRYFELLDLYRACKKEGKSRYEFLRAAAKVPGMYVPSLYRVSYNEDGTLASFSPLDDEVPARVQKEIVHDFHDSFYPEKPLVPYLKVIQDRVVLEVQRGCIRGCRFCQAGMVYRPVRERSLEDLKQLAEKMLAATGQDEITLSSLSTSDYSRLPELIGYLMERFRDKKVNLSLPSLRIDAFSLDVMSKVQDVSKSSLTFAPEAGTQRMRDVINKGLTEEEILGGAREAFRGGWNKVKLYFMLGLPGEREEDVQGIAYLAEKIAKEYYALPKESRKGKVGVTISTSYFIPKPFTPFQWAPMLAREQFLERQRLLQATVREQLNKKSLSYHWHDAGTGELEGILARGDRRLFKSIEDAYRAGCIFDAWSEHFQYEKWREVLEKNGVSVEFYNLRQRAKDELLPWDFIDIGVSRQFLYQEYERSMQQTTTPNCRKQCSGCGVSKFGSGVCVDARTKKGEEQHEG